MEEHVMKVITNYHRRELDSGDNGSGFKYKGWYYLLDEFMPTTVNGWDGVLCDSMFSGIVIKLDPRYDDYIIVGRVVS